MTALTPARPVTIRREAEPHVLGGHLWVVRHDGETVAAFTKGERALGYVDCEMSAWYRQRRDNQSVLVKALVGSVIGLVAKNAATKRQGRK